MLGLSRRRIKSIAMRHVEQLTVFNDGHTLSAATLDKSPANATVVPEMQLQIRTANLNIWMKLVEPSQIDNGDKFPSFRDVCKGSELLYFDELSVSFNPDTFLCADPSLLSAICSTSMVIHDQRIERREDVNSLLISHLEGAQLHFRTANSTDWAPPAE